MGAAFSTDAIYISLGQHLGGAVLIDGKLQVGATGKSGTFEHMTPFRMDLPVTVARKAAPNVTVPDTLY